MQVAILYPVVKEKSEKIAQNRDFLNRYVKLFESDFLLCFVFILLAMKFKYPIRCLQLST